jgi:hypothetical protein
VALQHFYLSSTTQEATDPPRLLHIQDPERTSSRRRTLFRQNKCPRAPEADPSPDPNFRAAETEYGPKNSVFATPRELAKEVDGGGGEGGGGNERCVEPRRHCVDRFAVALTQLGCRLSVCKEDVAVR